MEKKSVIQFLLKFVIQSHDSFKHPCIEWIWMANEHEWCSSYCLVDNVISTQPVSVWSMVDDSVSDLVSSHQCCTKTDLHSRG